MTIKDLKEFLSQFPDDMIIAERMYSDYGIMPDDRFSVMKMRKKFGSDELYEEDDWRYRTDSIYKVPLEATMEPKDYLVYQGN